VRAVIRKGIIALFISFAFASHGETQNPVLQEALKGHYLKAFRMFDKRCNKNDGYACGMVGYFHNKGRCV
jgi:hypothetical protein